jgi:hypothetical protein
MGLRKSFDRARRRKPATKWGIKELSLISVKPYNHGDGFAPSIATAFPQRFYDFWP